jgi:hypothetical protein
MVQPTTFFGLKPMRSTVKNVHAFDEAAANVDAVEAVTGCSGSITPKCLSNLYGFSGATAYTTGLMGIAGFLEEYPSKSDLSTFMKSYETEGNTAQTYTCTVVNGGSCPTSPSSPGVEANLDVQYARAITEDIPNVFYSVGGRFVISALFCFFPFWIFRQFVCLFYRARSFELFDPLIIPCIPLATLEAFSLLLILLGTSNADIKNLNQPTYRWQWLKHQRAVFRIS